MKLRVLQPPLSSYNKLIQFSRFCSSHTVRVITKKIHVHKSNDYNKDIAEAETPLCVLLGWGNSTQKQLKKYSEIYEKKGFDTITVSPLLIDALLLPQIRGKKISYQILETIRKESNGRKVPVVFHQFSNGGCALYYFICEELTTKGSAYAENMKVAGSIFDSCPIVPSFESVSLAQTVFTNEIDSPILKTLVWYCLKPLLTFVVWLNPVVKLFMDGLKNSPIMAPQMFFYSKSDMLAPYEDITAFLKCRKEIGVEVMAKLWDDSPHVRHLMHDQDTYIEMVHKFIDKLWIKD